MSLPALPDSCLDFIREADKRIGEYESQRKQRKGFVPSDFEKVGRVLQHLEAAHLAPGLRFCEWGSGFGVVAGLASLLGYESYGIEIQGTLVEAARQLMEDFDLTVEFAEGTVVPELAHSDDALTRPGSFIVNDETEYTWWQSDAVDGHAELELEIEDFDVVFVYPWPGEESVVEHLFSTFAARGALLLTHHGVTGTLLQRQQGTGELEELGWF